MLGSSEVVRKRGKDVFVLNQSVERSHRSGSSTIGIASPLTLSEVLAIKHHYDKGAEGCKGIEY
jgi:hypothetical protein